ncbi:MAG: hypothetical protein KatS3mg027_0032 [Bacteroidia bacterium]|nr:MAG: hypothetical protein KatS3mg027_0032 [Bacteroidia bacterium]
MLDTFESVARNFGCRVHKLVANLPYQIATPLVLNLLYGKLPWHLMVVTTQLELAEKMAAGPGHPDYGAVSVLVQAAAAVAIDRRIPRSAFWPRPEVVSAIVVIRPDDARRNALPPGFAGWVHRLWSKRRKKIGGALKELTGRDDRQISELLASSGIDPETRVEKLPPEKFVELIQALAASEKQLNGSS